jgi:hypothetical protein
VESAGTKYGIFVFPDTENAMEELCNKQVGFGSSCCIRKNCKITHRGEKVKMKAGLEVVAKTATTVFSQPSTHHTNVTSEVIKEWKRSKQTLQEWVELMTLTNASNAHEVYTKTDIGAVKVFSNYDREYRSPMKLDSLPFGKNDTFSDLIRAKGLAKRKLDSLEFERENDEVINLTDDEDFDRLDESWFKKRVTLSSEVLEELADKLDERDNIISGEGKVLLTRTEHLESSLGTRVETTNSEYQAPTVWASLALLGGLMEEMKKFLEDVPISTMIENKIESSIETLEQKLATDLGTLKAELTLKVCRGQDILKKMVMDKTKSVDNNILLLAKGAAKLKDEVMDIRGRLTNNSDAPSIYHINRLIVAAIDEELKEVHARLDSLATSLPSISGDGLSAQHISATTGVDELRDMFAALASRVNKLVADSDNEAVKFFGLGFREYKECEACVILNLNDCPHGMIVDVHLVLEHVYDQVSENEGGVKVHQGLRKADLDDLTQSLLLTSFDSRLPKYFASASSSTPSIRKPNASYFDRIPSYRDWDEPVTGFRDRLKEELQIFDTAHTEVIRNSLDPTSLSYSIETTSVTNSVTWILLLVSYIDDTYKSLLTQNTFTTEKAWKMVTQLARRIFYEVSIPRLGVKNFFKVSEPAMMAPRSFYPIVRCHDIMNRYKVCGFKDDPSIASEYVKFLAANSVTDLLDKWCLR